MYSPEPPQLACGVKGLPATIPLSIDPPPVTDPSIRVAAGRIVVCPMNNTSLCIPLILSIQYNHIPNPQRPYRRRDVDVVGDEDALPQLRAQDKSLMTASAQVVRQKALDPAVSRDHLPLRAVPIGGHEFAGGWFLYFAKRVKIQFADLRQAEPKPHR